MQWRGGPVAWVSRKAKFVPQSSCEAEVFASVLVLKEAEFVAQVGEFMGVKTEHPTACITDNQAALMVIKHPGATKRTVHFARWLHYAREVCLRNRAEMFFARTEDMMADSFTKAVDKTKFLKCRDYIMTRSSLVTD